MDITDSERELMKKDNRGTRRQAMKSMLASTDD